MFEEGTSKITSVASKSVVGILQVDDGHIMIEVDGKTLNPANIFRAFGGADIMITCTVVHEETPDYYAEI